MICIMKQRYYVMSDFCQQNDLMHQVIGNATSLLKHWGNKKPESVIVNYLICSFVLKIAAFAVCLE